MEGVERRGGHSVVQPLLTDQYQITMAYAYWKSGKTTDIASFDLFFRKCPFKGEFTIFAGLSECLQFLKDFQFSSSDIDYLKTCLPNCEEEFFSFLTSLSPKSVKVEAMEEGDVCFPRVPLIKVTGPLIMVQLLETTFLNLVNFASLIATNAARFRAAAGKNKKLFELGLRRAQGPDGGLSASKYAFLGGYDGTSNVLAGKLYNIPVVGTHSHSFVSSFTSLEQVQGLTVTPQEGRRGSGETSWAQQCLQWRSELSSKLKILDCEANDGELAAFISFAAAFPGKFTALLDTYDVLRSGMLNFCAVCLALNDNGYRARGVRIDSGDLAYLSNKIKDMLSLVSTLYHLDWLPGIDIIASNDINEGTILSLAEQGNSITTFGTGTHLVTCQRQPALGCVFKLVSINNLPTVKLSQDLEKMTMPGYKKAYRLYGRDGYAILDLLQLPDEDPPRVYERFICRHPFEESKRAFVTPHRVEILHSVVWDCGEATVGSLDLVKVREKVIENLKSLRSDHVRSLNPTPYKVSVSDRLYQFIHNLWLESAPIDDKMPGETPVAMIVCRDIALKLSSLTKIGVRQFLVQSLIKSYDLTTKLKLVAASKASVDDLLTYHSRDYVRLLSTDSDSATAEDLEEHGLGYDCPSQDNLLDWCLTVAGGSVTAARLLVSGQARLVINWAGGWHHAHRDMAAGFCYVNDIVIAIHKLQSKFKRILYIDLDIHHGDGVEEAFSSTDKVLTFSIHKMEPGFFPGSGHLADVGSGRGRYHSINVPLAEGVTDSMYTSVFSSLLPLIMTRYKPDCLVVQCGADCLVGDPLGGFNLTPTALSDCVKELMTYHTPLLVLGGGGYNRENTARCWTAITAAILGTPLDDDIPDEDHYFTSYGPDFTVGISAGCVKNKNKQEDIDLMISTIKANIELINKL